MATEVQTVLTGMSYLECPRWHDDRIWVADFYTHQVVSVAEDGSDLRVEAQVPGQPSGLGWLPDGRLLVVSMSDAKLLRREHDGSLVVHADLEPHVTGHPNDMVVDAQGRAWVGNFGFDLMAGADIAPTVLLRVDPDGTVTEVADDLWFPNGTVITDDGVLLVDETFGNRITAFDIGVDGSLTNRRVWASFGEIPESRQIGDVLPLLVVAPDGCGLDAEGALWVADANHARVVRVRWQRRTHPLPVLRPRLQRGGPHRRPGGRAAVRPGRRPPRRYAVTSGPSSATLESVTTNPAPANGSWWLP